MADICDLTDERMEREEAIRSKLLNQPHAKSDNCIECGVHIPEARQQATNGTEYCIGCQELHELKGRQFRHG